MMKNILYVLTSISFATSCGSNNYSTSEEMYGKHKSFRFGTAINDFRAEMKVTDINHDALGVRFVTYESKDEYLIEPGFYKQIGYINAEDPDQFFKQYTCGEDALGIIKTTFDKQENVNAFAIKLDKPTICRFKFIVEIPDDRMDDQIEIGKESSLDFY